MKIKPRFSFHYVAYSILIFAVIFSFVNLVTATTPNPGHPWSELGDGVFSFSNGQTASAYTYTYPSANSTVLTTNTAVTVAQGGTGVGTLTGIVIGNATSNMSAVVLGANQSIRRNSGDTAYEAFTPGTGTVTAVSIATANGISGSSSGGATPALTLSLGAITPTTVNGLTFSGSGTLTLTTSLTNNGGTGGTITWPAGAPTLTIPSGGGTLGTNAFNSTAFLSSVTAHNLLSATHGDATTASVVRGDIMFGNSTPKWDRLAFPATPTGKILQATATDIAWSTNPITIGTSASVSGSNTGDQTISSLGGTTVGSNFFTLTNPSAITFPRINADNTVTALDAASFRTAIGAGTGGGTGTVTSVSTAAANNGVTATWSMTSPTPALTIGLGAITPSSLSSSGNISTTGTGTITSAGLFTGTAGVSIGSAQSYTGAGAVTLSSAATTALTIGPGTTGQLVLNSANTSASAIDINAIGTVAGNAITLDTTDGGIAFTAAGANNGDITLTATDDLTLNTGSAASILNIGTNTQGIVINIGTNDTTADTINIGSAKDTTTIRGTTLAIGNATDNVSITDANWSITGAGALTVTSCVGCGGTTTTIVKAANQASTASTTTLQNDNTLFFAMTASKTYMIEAWIPVDDSNTTADLKFSFTAPSGATLNIFTSTWGSATTTVLCNIVASAQACTTTVNSAVNFIQVHGFVANSTTAGNLQFQFAQGTTMAASFPVIKKGATLTYTPTSGADLAEIYSTNDTSIQPGDVVTLDSSLKAGVRKTEKAYDMNTVGIISTSPGLVIGTMDDSEAMPVMVALSGRVSVKVNTENGPIKFGDLLTSSSTPGVAMRATKAGQIIGQAMSEFNDEGTGMVMAFIKMDHSNGAKLSDIVLPTGLNEDGTVAPAGDMDKIVLAQFMAQKEQLATAVNLSEINTDRMMAGLEVISPKILTDELFTNYIEPVDKNIIVKLAVGGQFIITLGSNDSPVVSVDDSGNAYFASGLTIGNEEQANGITLYDTVTKQPYCTRVTNGSMVTSPGNCSEVLLQLPNDSINTQNSANVIDSTPTEPSTMNIIHSVEPEANSVSNDPAPSVSPEPAPTPETIPISEPVIVLPQAETTPEPIPVPEPITQ